MTLRDWSDAYLNRSSLWLVVFVFGIGFIALNVAISPYYRFDPANYATTMRILLGENFTGTGLRRPWLIALPLAFLDTFLPTVVANRILGIVSALSIVGPLYLLYQRVGRTWIALLAAGTVTFLNPYAGMLNWGYITFIGIFFYFLTMWQLLRTKQEPTRRNTLLLSVGVALVLYAHQVTALYLVVSVAVFTSLHALRRRNEHRIYLRYPLAGVLGTILALPVLPIYLDLFLATTGSGGNAAPMSVALHTVWLQVRNFVLKIARIPSLLVALGVIALYGFYHGDEDDYDLTLAVLAIAIPSLTILLHNAAARMLYFFPPLAGLWATRAFDTSIDNVSNLLTLHPESIDLSEMQVARFMIAVFLTLALLTNAATYTITANNAAQYYQTMTSEEARTLEYIEQETAPSANIVTSHKSYGWAVEGYAGRNAFEPQGQKSYMKTYTYPAQDRQARIQDRVFSAMYAAQNGNIRAAFSAPYGTVNTPSFGVNTGNYRTYLYTPDTESTVVVDGDSQPLSTAKRQLQTQTTNQTATVTTVYQWEDATLRRTVTLSRNTSSATITYHGTNIDSLHIPITFANQTQPVNTSTYPGGVHAEVPNGFGMTVDTYVNSTGRVAYQNDSNNAVAAVTIDDVDESSITVQFDLNRNLTNESVSGYYTRDVIQRNNLTHIVVLHEPQAIHERNYDSETVAWFEASPFIKEVYSSGNATAYRILAESSGSAGSVQQNHSETSA